MLVTVFEAPAANWASVLAKMLSPRRLLEYKGGD